MPTYDYQCRNCGNRVEVLHGVNDAGPSACTVCGGHMRKLLSSPTIVFKGSGWAKKDRSTTPAASASDGGKPADTSTKTESKSDSPADATTNSESSTSTSSTKTTSTGGDGTSD